MKSKIILVTMVALSLTEVASACQFDTDCIYPAKCVKYKNSVDGVCAGGYQERQNDNYNQPADIYGSSGGLIVGIINLFRSHRKPKAEEASHE